MMNLKPDYNYSNQGLVPPRSSQGYFNKEIPVKEKQRTVESRENNTASILNGGRRTLMSSQNSIEQTDYVQTLIKRKNTKK